MAQNSVLWHTTKFNTIVTTRLTQSNPMLATREKNKNSVKTHSQRKNRYCKVGINQELSR